MRLLVLDKNLEIVFETIDFSADIAVASRAAGSVNVTLSSTVTSEILYFRDEMDAGSSFALFVEAGGRRTGGIINDAKFSYESDVITVSITACDPLGSVMAGVITTSDPTATRASGSPKVATMDAASGSVAYFAHQIAYAWGVMATGSWWNGWTDTDIAKASVMPVYIAKASISKGYLARDIEIPMDVAELPQAMEGIFDQVPELSFISKIVLPGEDDRLPGGGFIVEPIIKPSQRVIDIDYANATKEQIERAVTSLVKSIENEAGKIDFSAIPDMAIVYTQSDSYTIEESIVARSSEEIVYGGGSGDNSPLWDSLKISASSGRIHPLATLLSSNDAAWTPKTKAEILAGAPQMAGSREVVVNVTDAAPWRPLLDFFSGEEIFFAVPYSPLFYAMTITGISGTLDSDSPTEWTITCEKTPFTTMASLILDKVAREQARREASENTKE